MRTHYQNLKVAENAPVEVIRAAYRALSQQYHPDRNPNPEALRIMQIINDSYEVLSDPTARARHDDTIRRSRAESARMGAGANGAGAGSRAAASGARTSGAGASSAGGGASHRTGEPLWQVLAGGQVRGPLTMAGLVALLQRGEISLQSPASPWGRNDWQPLGQMLQAFTRRGSQQAPPPRAQAKAEAQTSSAGIYVLAGVVAAIGIYSLLSTPLQPKVSPSTQRMIDEIAQRAVKPLVPPPEKVSPIMQRMLDEIAQREGKPQVLTPRSAPPAVLPAVPSYFLPDLTLRSPLDPPSDFSAEAIRRRREALEAESRAVAAAAAAPSMTRPTGRGAFSVYERPALTPFGKAWPGFSSYLAGAPREARGGLSSLTVDNTGCSSDVHVKLFVRPARKSASVVREALIKGGESFEFGAVDEGAYDIRYRDLESGHLSKSEPFDLNETEEANGTRYSVMTLTLYKVDNGNTQVLPLDEDDF